MSTALNDALDKAAASAPLHDRLARSYAPTEREIPTEANVRMKHAADDLARQAMAAGLDMESAVNRLVLAWVRRGYRTGPHPPDPTP